MSRKLTDIEELFMQEAAAGGFLPAIDDEGFPYALGATHTGSLFSMEIKETFDRYSNGAIYSLPDGVIAEIMETESAQASKAQRTSP